MLDDIVPLPYARETLIEIRRRGYRLALASSGKPEHTEHYLDMLAARSVAEAWTTSQDVEATKPAPGRCCWLGDSTWDCGPQAGSTYRPSPFSAVDSLRGSCARRARDGCSVRLRSSLPGLTRRRWAAWPNKRGPTDSQPGTLTLATAARTASGLSVARK